MKKINEVSERNVLNAILKNDFYSYLQKVFYEVEGGKKFKPNWHIGYICYKLEQVRLGSIRNLIINVPPRSLKSIIVNVAFSTWILGHYPNEGVISASYGADLSDVFARKSKIVMESSWYKQLFPKSAISKSRSASTDFSTISRGCRLSTSVEGATTGRGCNYMIIDDPLKPSDAGSDVKRNKVNDWFHNTMLSRLDDQNKGAIVIIMQRVHEDDLTGHLLETSDSWEHINMPLIATEDETWEYGDLVYERKKGELLHTGNITKERALELQKELGSRAWSSQYQQDPCPIGGGVVQEEWLQYYQENRVRGQAKEVVISWDTASKTGENNAYSACSVMVTTNLNKVYMLESLKVKLEMPKLIDKVVEVYEKYAYMGGGYNRTKLLIEDKSSGTPLIQTLEQGKDKRGRKFPVVAIKPEGDKVSRLDGASILIENGVILFPQDKNNWWKDFKDELLKFPASKFNDQVDAFSQAANYILNNNRW